MSSSNIPSKRYFPKGVSNFGSYFLCFNLLRSKIFLNSVMEKSEDENLISLGYSKLQELIFLYKRSATSFFIDDYFEDMEFYYILVCLTLLQAIWNFCIGELCLEYYLIGEFILLFYRNGEPTLDIFIFTVF